MKKIFFQLQLRTYVWQNGPLITLDFPYKHKKINICLLIIHICYEKVWKINTKMKLQYMCKC